MSTTNPKLIYPSSIETFSPNFMSKTPRNAIWEGKKKIEKKRKKRGKQNSRKSIAVESNGMDVRTGYIVVGIDKTDSDE